MPGTTPAASTSTTAAAASKFLDLKGTPYEDNPALPFRFVFTETTVAFIKTGPYTDHDMEENALRRMKAAIFFLIDRLGKEVHSRDDHNCLQFFLVPVKGTDSFALQAQPPKSVEEGEKNSNAFTRMILEMIDQKDWVPTGGYFLGRDLFLETDENNHFARIAKRPPPFGSMEEYAEEPYDEAD